MLRGEKMVYFLMNDCYAYQLLILLKEGLFFNVLFYFNFIYLFWHYNITYK